MKFEGYIRQAFLDGFLFGTFLTCIIVLSVAILVRFL